MKTFNLPDLGEGLPDAEIQEWYVTEGDYVEKDQPLAMMETAKAAVDVPAPYAGKIEKLFGQAGDTIKTGEPLVGFVSEQDQTDHDSGTVVGQVSSDNVLLEAEAATAAQKTVTQSQTKPRALPAAKMLAKQLGVDLSQVSGSGPDGKITPDDVQRAAGQHSVAPGYQQLKGFRRTMAQQMTRAHQNIVPATIFDDARIGHWDEQVDITVRLLRSVINACQQAPQLNAYFDGDAIAIKKFSEVNIGVAVDTENGLYVPVIKQAEQMTDSQLREQVNVFKQKIRDRSITPEEMDGATITFSNYGSISGRYATPVIVPPMVAIVGVGRLHPEVVPGEQGQVCVERSAPISLTFDHRAITGGEAARFLKVMIDSLED